jgi:hypothetical protein
LLEKRMDDWIARRERETGAASPMRADLRSHGMLAGKGPFGSAQEAYDVLHVNPMRVGRTVHTLVEKLRALGYA